MAVTTGAVFLAQTPNPIVPRYGLFNAATGPLDLPVHARNGGLKYQTTVCDLPRGYEVECQADQNTKTFDESVSTITGLPFIVYAGMQCGTVGLVNEPDRVRQFLYQQLVAGEQATVESIFSNSSFGLANGLSGNPDVVNLGLATDTVHAFGKLEEWLYARYGLPGVIHVPMLGAAYVKNAKLITRDSTAEPWRTDVMTKVSFGNYAGLGPSGNAASAGNTWFYITGQVAIWRTPDAELLQIPFRQVIDRSTNTLKIILEREYVLTYDCYVAAIEAPLGPPAPPT